MKSHGFFDHASLKYIVSVFLLIRLAMSLWLVLTLVVLVSSAGIKAVEEDIHHGTPIKHGKQERDIDGHHNVHFDHEAILGRSCLLSP